MKVSIKNLPSSEIEVSGEISAETLENHRKNTIRYHRDRMELPGFRKGRAPENIVISSVGSDKILSEAAERALQDEYPRIIEEHSIRAIGKPEITVTKLAVGNPLGFKAKVSTLPDISLPDYKKVASDVLKNRKEESVPQTTDDDVNRALENLKKDYIQRSKDESEKKVRENIQLNDSFAKLFGDFKSLDDFKVIIKKNIQIEKEKQRVDKIRLAIIDELLKKTTFEIPNILVNAELKKMLADLKHNVEQSGLIYDDYLKHIKKTEDELKKSWEENAKKRVQIHLILDAIAKKEPVVVTKEEINKEVSNILNAYKDAPKERVQSYVEGVLTYEKVYKLLENQK